MARTKTERDRIGAIAQQLIEMTGEYCDQYLDEDYKQLAEKLILKMKRKRDVPFLRGRVNTWAAAVIYALGQINFLFDQSFEPYVAARDIPKYFGVSQSTVGQKAKAIRDMFDLFYWDPEFSTQAMRDSDPHKGKVVIDGIIVPIDMLPPDVQEELRRQGIV
jgi:hypothetical protein